jgi:creatinine amidohydrolase
MDDRDSADTAPWGRVEELRPDRLEAIVRERPVAYWPLGLIEHHGWHLPVGFDGVKAQRLCLRMVERTGGLLLPVMWWGAGGGHELFKWTLYQDPDAALRIVCSTVEKLVGFGVRAFVLLAGHYPWEGLLRQPQFERFRESHPDLLLLVGSEVTIASPPLALPRGDHAARQETSYGLALLPELVDRGALRPGRDDSAWPRGRPPPGEGRHPGVVFDASEPRYAQLGEDPRASSAEEGEAHVQLIVEAVASRVNAFLAEAAAPWPGAGSALDSGRPGRPREGRAPRSRSR